jgi:signal transduction histidine kinase
MNTAGTKELRLLNIEDSEDDSLLLRHHLTRAGYQLTFERVDTSEGLATALNDRTWDLVISDYVMPNFSALAALKELKKREIEIPFIVISGAIGEETAVAAMRAGACDYIMKDNLTRLAPAIERELLEAAHRRERRKAEHALRTAERLATLGRLAAVIAHEINNPLEAITNVLYLLRQRADLDPLSRDYIRIADEELARVAHIVRQALSFSRGHAGASQVRLSAVLQNVLDLYGSRVRAGNIKVEKQFDCPGDIVAIEGEMRQVFSNLIVNAVDAVGDGGTVVLRISLARNRRGSCAEGVRVLVADNGVGIKPEYRDELFEPFFTTKGNRGSGLGLWISREIVQKHGGSIHLHSSTTPGQSGTVFSVFLPLESAGQPVETSVTAAAS